MHFSQLSLLTLMDFPERLAALRKNKGLTQQVLSEAIGLHISQLKRYEAGTSQPTLDVLRKLAVELSVNADMLLFDKNERGPDDELRLQFEALQQFSPKDKDVAKSVLESLILKHDANRFKQANENLGKMATILQNGDIESFINLVESEALTLHAMMLTSNPYFILMKPNTLEIINRIWEYRQEKNSNICFTLDAGANVHVLFPQKEKENVLQFIENELSKFCQKKQYICDEVGFGGKQI